MVAGGRRKSVAFFITLGAGLIAVSVMLYLGGVLLNWRTGILLFLGILFTIIIIAGIVLNTVFLVREIRRGEQHDAFINAVTHELKTPIASIRLYTETMKARHVDEEKRQEFYSIILANADRLSGTIEQILRTGRIGASGRPTTLASLKLNDLGGETVARSRGLHHVGEEVVQFQPSTTPLEIMGDLEELRAAVSNLIDNA